MMKTQSAKIKNGEGARIKAADFGLLKTKWRQVVKDRQLYLIMIPFILYYVLFVYRPMGGLVIAFKDYSVYKGIAASPWVGLENFRTFFESPYFFRLLRNTVLISVYTLIFSFPASIVLALLLNEVRSKLFRSVVQTFSYLPHFISVVVIAGMVTSFLAPGNGVINLVIEAIGGEKIYFLSKAEYFRRIYIIMNIWSGVGYGSIVYIAAISGIDQQLYEACTIDGGGKWSQMWHVTLPGIMPTIVTLFIMQIGNIMNVGYETIILLYQPATYETADVINTYVYRLGIEESNYSLSAAAGMFNSVVGFVLVMVANYVSNRVNDMGLW